MKVFLSWSGPMSKKVASALYSWLPNVIQAIRPWMSSEDIDRGARWSAEIASELSTNGFGILCMTPDNLAAPWVLFEAGALSKAFDTARVCPYLVGVEVTALEGPLAQFNAARATQDDTFRVLETINKQLGDKKLEEASLREAFAMWWPKLDERLTAILAEPSAAVVAPRRDVPDMVEEVLEIQRTILREMQMDRQPLSALTSTRQLPIDEAVRQRVHSEAVWKRLMEAGTRPTERDLADWLRGGEPDQSAASAAAALVEMVEELRNERREVQAEIQKRGAEGEKKGTDTPDRPRKKR